MSAAKPTVAGLFAGIGGIELGLQRAGFTSKGLCEIDDAGRQVLRTQFDVSARNLWRDVTMLRRIPKVDVVSAGFPCQDLSQAGRKSGIAGSQSSLVSHVFRLIDEGHVKTVLLENVSYMLRLDSGEAMSFLVSELERRGYSWAYRVVDARAFGAAQRRQRVIMVASRAVEPSAVLHADDYTGPDFDDAVGETDDTALYGFYWTEGLRGLGWTKNAVPTVKGGSRIGIPSPPAVWDPATGLVGTPSIADAEALQGFPRGWTAVADGPGFRKGARWHLVGNAVCVPMSEWVGERLINPGSVSADADRIRRNRWPLAARGGPDQQPEHVNVSIMPMATPFDLRASLQDPLKPLSAKATAGFLSRAAAGKLRFSDGFLESLESHLERMRGADTTAA